MDLPKRKPNRLKEYDYSQPGYYFITICTHQMRQLFWPSQPLVGADIIRPDQPRLSKLGQIVERAIRDIPSHYAHYSVEKYVIMPNHIHLILRISEGDGRMISAPTKPVPIVIGQLKRTVAKQAGFSLWQKGYCDHVIRTESVYLRVWNYIDTNPAKWSEDRYYIEKEGFET